MLLSLLTLTALNIIYDKPNKKQNRHYQKWNHLAWQFTWSCRTWLFSLCRMLMHTSNLLGFFFEEMPGWVRTSFYRQHKLLAFKSLSGVIRYYQMTTYNLCLANETLNRKCHSPHGYVSKSTDSEEENSVMCCCHSLCMVWGLMQELPITMFARWIYSKQRHMINHFNGT